MIGSIHHMTRLARRLGLAFGLAATAAAGAALASLTFAPVASASWDWHSLPSGYGVSSYQTTCHISTDPCIHGDGSVCNHVTITAPGTTQYQTTLTDCADPSFQSELDSFVDATICVVNPGAGGSACAPTTTASTTQQTTTSSGTTTVVVTLPATTTTTAQTTTVATTTQTNPTTTTTTASSTAPTPSTTTVTTTTTVPAPAVSTVTVTTSTNLAAALSLIQQRLDVLDARVTALENSVGEIIGEEKNEPPFTNPA